jgi:hypothetical protein
MSIKSGPDMLRLLPTGTIENVHGGYSLRRLDAATDGRTKETNHDGKRAIRTSGSEGTDLI